MSPTKWRKKPVVIEAIQYTGTNYAELKDFCPSLEPSRVNPYIPTLEGDMTVSASDWVIKGVQGEFYPIKDSIFRETYESVSE